MLSDLTHLLPHPGSDEDESATEVPCVMRSADCCSVFKAFIGSNYLGIPYAFHLCGVILSLPLVRSSPYAVVCDRLELVR
jgi:hypothetical protein